ncbi:hypothetical protein BGX27_003757, partial [Mortierella sp. AM989]
AISWMFEREVEVGSNSIKHKKPSTALDITRVQGYLRDNGILWKSGQHDQETPVVDLQYLGGDKMIQGRLDDF